MTNRLLTLAVIGAVGAGSAASMATAHGGKRSGTARAQIATVSSYTGGTLTLKTTSGLELSAKVTRRTRIDCLPLAATSGTTPTSTTPAADDPTDTTPAGTTPTRRGPRGDDGEERGGRGPGRGERMQREDDDSDVVCDTTSLTSGAGVLAAATELTATGQRFTKLVLVDTSTASSAS